MGIGTPSSPHSHSYPPYLPIDVSASNPECLFLALALSSVRELGKVKVEMSVLRLEPKLFISVKSTRF